MNGIVFQTYLGGSAQYLLFGINSTNSNSINLATTAVKHYEIGYNNGNLMLFVNGTKQATVSGTIARAARDITIGGAIGCWFDEFRILDGICAHTAAFTPPRAKYSVTDETISLLHFD